MYTTYTYLAALDLTPLNLVPYILPREKRPRLAREQNNRRQKKGHFV